MTFTEINDTTGFANGETFTTDAEVRAYFQRAELISMMAGGDTSDFPAQSVLDEMAQTVIANRWHYTEATA